MRVPSLQNFFNGARMENPAQNVNETKVDLGQENEAQEEEHSTVAAASAKETIIDIPASIASSSSSYDTDCSTASSTCCTRQGEHIYMQREAIPATPLPEAEDLGLLKYVHRQHFPWFILVISIIEVSRDTLIPLNQRSRKLSSQER